MPDTYIDPFMFVRATHGLEYQTLIGNLARFTTAQSAGAVSLTVPTSGANSVTVALNQFDQISIFDGSNTEVVQVGAAGAAIGATSIPLLAGTSLQFAHGIGVAWCSDGTAGSLADQVVDASAWIETMCNQALLLTTYTNELLAMPTMRASISADGILHFRPRHWPIQTLTALTIATSATLSVSYDPAQAFIDMDKQVVTIPNLLTLSSQGQGQSPYPIVPPQLSRQQSAQLSITYQAGYAYGSLPGDVREAAVLVVSDFLAKRYNPIGAPDIADGSSHISAVLRGDLTGESLLIKRAMKILSKYSVQSF